MLVHCYPCFRFEGNFVLFHVGTATCARRALPLDDAQARSAFIKGKKFVQHMQAGGLGPTARQPTDFLGLCCANLRGHVDENLLALLRAVLRKGGRENSPMMSTLAPPCNQILPMCCNESPLTSRTSVFA